MSQNQIEHFPQGSGLGGMLRLLGILLMLALASLATLVVFDVISLADMGDLSIKLGLITAVVAIASAAIWALTRTARQ